MMIMVMMMMMMMMMMMYLSIYLSPPSILLYRELLLGALLSSIDGEQAIVGTHIEHHRILREPLDSITGDGHSQQKEGGG